MNEKGSTQVDDILFRSIARSEHREAFNALADSTIEPTLSRFLAEVSNVGFSGVVEKAIRPTNLDDKEGELAVSVRFEVRKTLKAIVVIQCDPDNLNARIQTLYFTANRIPANKISVVLKDLKEDYLQALLAQVLGEVTRNL
jgi:hypothetical protein